MVAPGVEVNIEVGRFVGVLVRRMIPVDVVDVLVAFGPVTIGVRIVGRGVGLKNGTGALVGWAVSDSAAMGLTVAGSVPR